MREALEFPVNNLQEIKIKLLNWIKQFSSFILLDNHQYHSATTSIAEPAFECLVAAGSRHSITVHAGTAYQQLKAFSNQHAGEWLFGHLCYDLKNETEQLQSSNFDGIHFPDAHFFVPEILIKLNKDQLEIYSDQPSKDIWEEIKKSSCILHNEEPSINIKSRIAKNDYLLAVEKIKAHIVRGDCYEINFCQEFFGEDALINPVTIYHRLTSISPVPFAALYKLDDKYCICASPERYLKKKGSSIISQPIKGTAKRNLTNQALDTAAKEHLMTSTKEKAENIMTVDLVRNDLSKICKEGSVKVEELFSIYSFPQVHQMISTISGLVDNQMHWTDAIKGTFPMASMTGAPKKRVMELIEQFEQTKRGLFSGAIGYITSAGDFDFNVVIRSILYNQAAKYLSFQAGSAITYYSDPEKEYHECILKSAAIKEVLRGKP